MFTSQLYNQDTNKFHKQQQYNYGRTSRSSSQTTSPLSPASSDSRSSGGASAGFHQQNIGCSLGEYDSRCGDEDYYLNQVIQNNGQLIQNKQSQPPPEETFWSTLFTCGFTEIYEDQNARKPNPSLQGFSPNFRRYPESPSRFTPNASPGAQFFDSRYEMHSLQIVVVAF